MADPVEKLAPGLATGNVPSPPLPSQTTTADYGGVVNAMGAGMTFKEVGQTGLRAFAGYVREDFLPQLQGRQASRTYREMADNSPVIGGILFAIMSAMRKVSWRVLPNPAGVESQERIDFVASLMDDMSMTWEETIAENLSMMQFGFSAHEIVYKRRMGRTTRPDPDNPGRDMPGSRYDDGLIGWRRLPVRGQDTVLKWFFDYNGQTTGLTQQPYIGAMVDIPIEKLLLFRPTAFKSNPEGRSILRNSVTSYWYVKRLQEQEVITYERFGGFPVMRLPSAVLDAAAAGDSASLALVNNMKRIVTNIRVDEQMGLLLPSTVYEGSNGPSNIYQFDLEFKTPTAGRSAMSPNETIGRHSINMMVSVLADWLQMGHEKTGTQGLSTNKVDMFFLAIEGYLNGLAAVYNRYALPRLWALNGWDEADMPMIEPDLAQRIDLDVLSNYVLRMSQTGMPLFPNEELQSYLMDVAGLPDVQDPLAAEVAGMTPELIAAMTDGKLNPPVPPQPGPNGEPPIRDDPMAKLIRGAFAKRVIRHGGPKFGVTTKAAKKKSHRVARINKYGRL